MNLQDQGYRFVFRAGEAMWIAPSEVRPSDVDCTDMDDAMFFLTVIEECGEPEQRPIPCP